MAGRPTVGMYSFRTPDPRRAGGFWAEVMSLPISSHSTDDLVMLDFDHEVGSVTWMFERDTATGTRSRVGLDLAVDDDRDGWRDLADRAERAGAIRESENDVGGVRWIAMTDPDGNPFRVFAPRPSEEPDSTVVARPIVPRAQVIDRTGRGTTAPDGHDGGAASWDQVESLLSAGQATCWLSVAHRGGGVHTRPLFAAWTGSSFVFASKSTAVKTRNLDADPRVSLAIDLGPLHVVVEGTATRLTARDDLDRARAAMLAVYDWPTEIDGDELDAPYAAPTSGGPPFQAWEIHPRKVIAFPTDDQVEPTRFVF